MPDKNGPTRHSSAWLRSYLSPNAAEPTPNPAGVGYGLRQYTQTYMCRIDQQQQKSKE